jgi:hypothetical protein
MFGLSELALRLDVIVVVVRYLYLDQLVRNLPLAVVQLKDMQMKRAATMHLGRNWTFERIVIDDR